MPVTCQRAHTQIANQPSKGTCLLLTPPASCVEAMTRQHLLTDQARHWPSTYAAPSSAHA